MLNVFKHSEILIDLTSKRHIYKFFWILILWCHYQQLEHRYQLAFFERKFEISLKFELFGELLLVPIFYYNYFCLTIRKNFYMFTHDIIHCVKSVRIRSFFWSAFSRIWTEYGETLRISQYSVQMRENTDLKKLRIWILFTQWMIDP